MGLDISAYRVSGYLGTESNDSDDNFCVYGATGFEDRADNMEGCYKEGEYMFGFRAGSYGGYNWWRDVLSQATEQILNSERYADTVRKRAKGVPGDSFMKLIWFSDCEGFIGTETSTELYEDFNRFEKSITRELTIQKYHEGGNPNFEFIVDGGDIDIFLTTYRNFMKAFKIASEVGGIVLFH
jgi:hypothetical protein